MLKKNNFAKNLVGKNEFFFKWKKKTERFSDFVWVLFFWSSAKFWVWKKEFFIFTNIQVVNNVCCVLASFARRRQYEPVSVIGVTWSLSVRYQNYDALFYIFFVTLCTVYIYILAARYLACDAENNPIENKMVYRLKTNKVIHFNLSV